MERINTGWATTDITQEQLDQYRFALKHVNVSKLCKKHGVTKEYVYRVLRGEHVMIAKKAMAILVLSEALAEYNTAKTIIENALQQKTA